MMITVQPWFLPVVLGTLVVVWIFANWRFSRMGGLHLGSIIEGFVIGVLSMVLVGLITMPFMLMQSYFNIYVNDKPLVKQVNVTTSDNDRITYWNGNTKYIFVPKHNDIIRIEESK